MFCCVYKILNSNTEILAAQMRFFYNISFGTANGVSGFGVRR